MDFGKVLEHVKVEACTGSTRWPRALWGVYNVLGSDSEQPLEFSSL